MALGWGERGVTGWHFHLKEMCVDSASQRRGLGVMLLSSLERDLARDKFDRVYLETRASSPSLEFYEACGYRNIGLISLSKRINV